MFISSVGWPRGFTEMHCNVAALWIRIDMQFEAEKYKKNLFNCFRSQFISLKLEV